MTTGHLGRYRQNKYVTASPGQLLLALYDGAIRFGRQARQAIADGDTAEKGESIGRVTAIISELTSTLDHSKSPDLCANLEQLYNYMIERLQEGSIKMQVEPIDEIILHLEGLREAWSEAVQKVEGPEATSSKLMSASA